MTYVTILCVNLGLLLLKSTYILNWKCMFVYIIFYCFLALFLISVCPEYGPQILPPPQQSHSHLHIHRQWIMDSIAKTYSLKFISMRAVVAPATCRVGTYKCVEKRSCKPICPVYEFSSTEVSDHNVPTTNNLLSATW